MGVTEKEAVMPPTNEEISKIHEQLISVHAEAQLVFECVETDEYRLAKREFAIFLSEYDKPRAKLAPEVAELSWKAFLNAQRAFIRAQIDLMHRNRLYGDVE